MAKEAEIGGTGTFGGNHGGSGRVLRATLRTKCRALVGPQGAEHDLPAATHFIFGDVVGGLE